MSKKAFNQKSASAVWPPVRPELVENGILDPLRVADIYRRDGFYSNEKFLAREISETMYKIGAALTNLGDEQVLGSKSHAPVGKMIAVFLADLSTRAKIAGAREILFPVADDMPLAKYIANLVQQYGLDINMTFRKTLYDLDHSSLGKIDMTVTKNPLYKNPRDLTTVIGFWEIADECKDKWEDEIQASSVSKNARKLKR